MNNFFRLNSYCYLIDGEKNGCIYNIIDGKMIIINKDIYEMLVLCEKNMRLKDVLNVNYNLLDKLQDMDIGCYHEKPVYIDKLAVGIPQEIEKSLPGNHEIPTVFIELDNTCNLNCIFCKKDDNTLFRRTGCKRWSLGGRALDLEMWKSIIIQVSRLSCKHLVFIGGEPFLHYEFLKELCIHAFDQGIEKITIYTNGSILDESILEFLKKYDIALHVQILGYGNETYETITGISSLGSKVFNNVKKMAVENINYTLTYLVNRFNEDEIETAFKEYSNFTKINKIRTEFIYPVPDNIFYSKKYRNSMYDKKKDLSRVSMSINSFCSTKKLHNCYSYQIGITAAGDVLPCIMSRKFILGNVRENDMAKILRSSNYEYYRNLNKDAIEKCKFCALKYGCFDCRALEFSATENPCGMEYCNI